MVIYNARALRNAATDPSLYNQGHWITVEETMSKRSFFSTVMLASSVVLTAYTVANNLIGSIHKIFVFIAEKIDTYVGILN